MIAWSIATLEFFDTPLRESISSSALRKISEYDAESLANIAWSVADLPMRDVPLLKSLSSSAIRKITEYEITNLAKLSWANAFLGMANIHFLLASVLASVPNRRDEMNSPGAHAILWASWRGGLFPGLWLIFSEWLTLGIALADVNTTDLLMMEAEWSKDTTDN